jgi:hypothetical protein
MDFEEVDAMTGVKRVCFVRWLEAETDARALQWGR